ncbi:MAG: AbrB/MazE/SpoVT family DNA-binding domain-containing protein [Thermodesulfobacteriota bacterium]
MPVEIREKMGLLPDTEVEFAIKGDTVRMKRKTGFSSRRPRDLINRMRKKATVKMTRDEILALTRG